MPAIARNQIAANQAVVFACDCRLDLVMSVLVESVSTNNSSGFDVLLYALRSYAHLPLEHVYLYIDLGARHASRRDELRIAAQQLFGSRLVTLQPRRLLTQPAWRAELQQMIASRPPDRAIKLLPERLHLRHRYRRDLCLLYLLRLRRRQNHRAAATATLGRSKRHHHLGATRSRRRRRARGGRGLGRSSRGLAQ